MDPCAAVAPAAAATFVWADILVDPAASVACREVCFDDDDNTEETCAKK